MLGPPDQPARPSLCSLCVYSASYERRHVTTPAQKVGTPVASKIRPTPHPQICCAESVTATRGKNPNPIHCVDGRQQRNQPSMNSITSASYSAMALERTRGWLWLSANSGKCMIWTRVQNHLRETSALRSSDDSRQKALGSVECSRQSMLGSKMRAWNHCAGRNETTVAGRAPTWLIRQANRAIQPEK